MSRHPKPTSRVIITINPAINPRVATSVYLSSWVSGITSSTTTKIIAPAAKASAYGRIGVKNVTATAPIIAAIGSTIAES